MSIVTVLEAVAGLEEYVCNYFGIEETWRVYPFSDETESYWMLVEEQVVYASEPLTAELVEQGKKIYSGIVLHNKVYRKEDATAMRVDTQCDGNTFLMVFDNTKECTDKTLADLWLQHWGVSNAV